MAEPEPRLLHLVGEELEVKLRPISRAAQVFTPTAPTVVPTW